jgi:hypothetical protein
VNGAFGQTVAGPVMVVVGAGLTVTVVAAEVAEQLPFVTMTW